MTCYRIDKVWRCDAQQIEIERLREVTFSLMAEIGQHVSEKKELRAEIKRLLALLQEVRSKLCGWTDRELETIIDVGISIRAEAVPNDEKDS